MKLKVSKQIFDRYPQVEIGIVTVKNACNFNKGEEIQNLLRKAEEKIRERISEEKVLEVPEVIKLREIYQSFGAKPRDYRSSIEALIRRVAKGNNLPRINPLVDLYNYISLEYILTAGGEDTNRVKGDLILDFANGGETFIPLGSNENSSPWGGEVVYKDDEGVICRCWNWREGDRTKLTEKTENAVLVLEDFNENSEKLLSALKELKSLIEKYCEADCEIKVINKENPEGEI
ncbi:MAG TPA: phenylalanine--tRNA ligase beta subunit-related protein [Candidatus Nanoarchaeia archaeon]|nr:phenylalanine--tRNA ligase beta subunit-related protein [Candidatus Nanoarchaeia archaeon]